MAGSAYFVYGNKALLRQAGIDADTAPKSAEDWMDMMKAVKAKTGKAGVVAGAKNQDVPVRWLYNPLLMTSCGQEKFDAIWSGKAGFQDPCSLRVFSYIAQIGAQKLWTPDVLATDIDPADVAFSQGKAGFDIGGTYTLSFLLAQGMKSDDILAFAVPPLKGSVYDHLAVGVDGLIEAAVTKDSKHRDDAERFLKFLTTSDEGAVFARTVGDLPAVKIPTDPAKVGAAMVGLIKGLDPANAPFAKSTIVDHLPDDTFNVVKLGLARLISGETTAAAVAAAADKASHS
jgi:multiple sugar transport system substrate-binding protein